MFKNLLRVPRLATEIVKRHAGHSKWANIKHTKSLKDAQKGALYTKLGQRIKVAIQEGGSIDPQKNLQLEHVIEQAKRVSMPAATVQSIIKSCQTDKTQAKCYTLEIKGPGSCIIMCELFTDNLHRTRQLIATTLKKHGSKFSDGGGRHSFHQKGVIETEKTTKPDEEILEKATDDAIECGAEEVTLLEGGYLQFVCDSNTLRSVTKALDEQGYKITSSSVEYIPVQTQNLTDAELDLCGSLYEKLENHPEIVKLSDNIA